jgi:predicted ATPase
MKPPRLESVRVRHFKAIRDSAIVKIGPLTVFVGNNGSGKSSLIEALEFYQTILIDDLDAAVEPWLGFEYIWNCAVEHRAVTSRSLPRLSNPLEIAFHGWHPGFSNTVGPGKFESFLRLNATPGMNRLFIEEERVRMGRHHRLQRDADGKLVIDGHQYVPNFPAGDAGTTQSYLNSYVWSWQFVSLIPQTMGHAAPQKRTGGRIRLAKDGRNVAEYLLSIKLADPAAFDGIFEALRYVLPYAVDLQPTLTSELERTVYLQMTEQKFKLPGWLLSTGTLRVLALLALLRHPAPPPLIVIDEIENGLDPRTIDLVVKEIQVAIENGRTQVIATTHSPYLLDLLALSHLVLVERIDGEPVFTRPGGRKELREWAKRFSPGRLYTMGKLKSER